MDKHINPSQVDPAEVSSTLDLIDPQYLEVLRIQMLKFATLQLNDSTAAEDAVQEALVGALKNAGSFGRRAALKTWVFAILKHKITDMLRQRQRLQTTTSLSQQDDEEASNLLFNRTGFWHVDERPVEWCEPAEAVKNDHFWRVFETCLAGLPEQMARLFMMREFLELKTQEICESEDISVSNLHVILYRARIRLRECLENRWFLKDEKK